MRKKSFITSIVFTIINLIATILCLILNIDLPTEGAESIALIVIVPYSLILFCVIIISAIFSIIFAIRGLKSESEKIRITSIVLLVLNVILLVILAVMMFRIFSLAGE